MVSDILIYASAAIAVGWGVAHLAPTRAVVSGFGELAAGNRLILTMEWIGEGATLIFIGVLVAVVGSVGAATDQLATAIKLLAAGMLVAMAVLGPEFPSGKDARRVGGPRHHSPGQASRAARAARDGASGGRRIAHGDRAGS